MPHDPDPDLRYFLGSNRSAASLLRDHERQIAAEGRPPVDLRTIDPAEWDSFLDRDVTIPDAVRAFLDGHDGTRLPAETVQSPEDVVTKFHGVTAPYYITASMQLQTTGRAWSYEPAAARFLTGFALGKADE